MSLKFFSHRQPILWVTHINPDGSEGGIIAAGAMIGTNVRLGINVIVLPGAYVPDNSTYTRGVLFAPYRCRQITLTPLYTSSDRVVSNKGSCFIPLLITETGWMTEAEIEAVKQWMYGS